MWLVVCLAAVGPGDEAVAQGLQKRVLVLHTARIDAQLTATLDTRLPPLLERSLPEGLDYYSEYIDQARFTTEEYRNAFRDFLRLKYQGQRIDVIIPVGTAALEFVRDNRSPLFNDTPLVFYTLVSPGRPVANATGIVNPLRLDRSIDLALMLQPDLRRLFVVSGTAPGDKRMEGQARAEFDRHEDRLDITYLSGLVTSDLEARLRALPPQSAVFFAYVTEDGRGARFHATEYLARVASVANAPTYSWADVSTETGIVGGNQRNQSVEAKALADLTLRVLRGEPADTIPPLALDTDVNQIDWRQLRRWGISEARVPAGATLLFREPNVLEEYKIYVVGTITLVVLQATLIGSLVIQRRRRRRAEESLRESEQRFRVMADTAPVMVWRQGPDKRRDFVNLPWLTFRGRTLEKELGDGWTDGVHPEDRDCCTRVCGAAFERREAFRTEYRMRRADGKYRWVLDTGVPRYLPDGTFSGYIGSCIDITERKETEEALRANEAKLRTSNEQIQHLAGRLITAQEQERSRIARELHDDVSQQIALLTMELGILGHTRTTERAVSEALTRVQGIAKSVHDLSHRLHPAKLRLLGLVSALDALRHELSQSGVNIVFTHDNIPFTLPPELTLSLFRIVQEGLQNAVKHSGAHIISVHLHGGGSLIELRIADDGIGFEVDAALGKGLGLVSMGERVQAIGGSLGIRSTPGTGTELTVRVPIESAQSTGLDVARVLLVDDNDAILDRAGEVLTPACLIVGKARDGETALESAEVLRPDVIVLDISMPGMTGFEVAAHLRGAGSTAALVFLTVHDDDEFVLAAKAAGGVGYVVKPRMASDLLPAVQQAQADRRRVGAIH